MPKLNPAIRDVASKLQEAVTALSHTDICRCLSDALRDANPERYCYVMDVYGDDQSGDVIYYCNGETYRAGYELGTANGKRTASIDIENAVDVVPRTVYDEEADEGDHYAAMEAEKFYTAGDVPLCERYISKSERNKMDKADFAGKGTSFPIKSGEDVGAAARSLGRAGSGNLSTSKIKSNIIAIAKRKGLEKYLPKSWQDGEGAGSKEARNTSNPGVTLIESASFLEEIKLREATSTIDYAIKLIQPGRGSSAYYPAEVLERDGPKVFTAGTHMYWNHATAAQEAARPEGDLNELAAVLTSNAYYDKAGKEGAGLYARAKVFADYAEKVAEKAKYTGLSIRARGTMSEAKAPDGKGNVLARFTAADSVDFVTKAGAGGKVLTESAVTDANDSQQREASEMDATEITKLVEAGVKAAVAPLLAENKKLSERLTIAAEAPAVINEYFGSVRVSEAIRQRVSRRAMESADRYIAEGKLDAKKFREFVESETKDEAKFISEATGGRMVVGMGLSAATQTPEQLREAQKVAETEHGKVMDELAGLFLIEAPGNTEEEREKRGERMRKAFAKGRAA